jgi:protein-tyrosine phosphatase
MFSIFNKKNSVTNIEWLAVDMHSHMLPGLDDGSPDLVTSLKLIKDLHELGYERFYFTPHIFTELYPNNLSTILPILNQVRAALKEADINAVTGAAAEYMVDDTFEVTDDLMTFPGNYILIEMSYMHETPNIDEVIDKLIAYGYKVILAHPERYLYYHLDKLKLNRFKDKHVFFQLNLLSVTGYYGKEVKKTADYLLKHNLYDFASSDVHHDKHLQALKTVVLDGSLYKKIGAYPFKNKELFL